MDPRLLKYYNRELQHVREMGAEFAEEFPKIAGRLGLEQLECADPYVERLLEGFGFLAARVQLKLDAEFPRFTQHLLEMVYPDYLTPVPSMAVVQFHADPGDGGLAEGFVLPRGTGLRSVLGKDDQTPCEYRTAHDATLWPIEIVEADYLTRETAAFEMPKISGARGVKAALRLLLRTTAGLQFDKLALERLAIYLHGVDQLPVRLYEQLLANAVAVVIRPPRRPAPWQEVLKGTSIRRVGFDDGQALLPCTPRSFQGYRLLQEYFAFPQRYLFVELTGLETGVRRCAESELEIVFLFDRRDATLENNVEPSQFVLGCVPAVNLFPRRADRIHLSDQTSEYHLVPDRTRPMDFEVHSVTRLRGYGTAAEEEQEFLPFYALGGRAHHDAFYTLYRTPRILSTKQRRDGARASYIGNEVFVSLVDGSEGPFRHSLRQLAPETLCTNRDLPLQMPVGRGKTDFHLETSAPVNSVRCVAGPTKPRQPLAYGDGEVSWRLISHLTLNYLSIVSDDQSRGAAALREMLALYGDASQPMTRKQIEGLVGVASKPIIRRLPVAGPITCGRGLEVSVTFDEAAFEGSGVFILGAVLDEFFARYVSINAFTETVVNTLDRGEVARWPARIGRRPVL
jgi:type VI secretion system protein ImpG